MTSLRVLHVDDEPDIREVVAMALDLDPSFDVHSCGSGSDALSEAAAWTPDLILLDVMMPVMDGPATLARLRATPSTAAIPVVFMTARAQSRELERFISLGAEGVIPKPFDPMTLAASVRAYVRPANDEAAARRERFRDRARKDAVALESHGAALAGDPGSQALLTQIRTLAHGLSGGGGVFGYHEISAAAAVLEEAVNRRLDGVAEADAVEAAIAALCARIAEE